MNFISNIIAEKANLADADDLPGSQRDRADPTVCNGADAPSGTIDPVHMVASGNRSLSRADNHVFPAESELKSPVAYPREGPLDGSVETEADFEDDGGFDLLSDSEENADPSGAGYGDTTRPSELFADIWTEDEITEDETTEENIAPEPEQDVFAEENPARGIPSAAPAQTAPETNAEALMRTMYQPDPTQPDDYQAQDDYPDHPGAPETEMPQAAAPAERQSTSPFGRLVQRQGTQPSEPASAASIPAPAPVSAPAPVAAEMAAPEPVARVNVPSPAAGRGRRKVGRVKTRLLGFGNDTSRETDLFASDTAGTPAPQTTFPVGWLVIVSGPGRGTAFSLANGVSQIGRGEDQAVRLDFGDNSISRANHAAIAYDPEQQNFFLGHGGKANLVRLNGNPVLSTEPLHSGAEIRIGETTLRFVGLCGGDFDWDKSQNSESENAQFG